MAEFTPRPKPKQDDVKFQESTTKSSFRRKSDEARNTPKPTHKGRNVSAHSYDKSSVAEVADYSQEVRIPKRRLKDEDDVKNGLKLQDVLGPRRTPQHKVDVPLTIEELRKAAHLRQRDRERVTVILETMDSKDFTEEDAWMCDFLKTEGGSVAELAKLLVDAKYDSPFILRPGYFQTLFSRFEKIDPGISQQEMGFPPQNIFMDSLTRDNRPGEIARPRNIQEAREALPPDLMLGLAGFQPFVKTGLDHLVRHESWLEDMSRHIVIDPNDDSKVSVAYGKGPKPDSIEEVEEVQDPRLLAHHTLAAISSLGHAIMEMHELKLCTESLPILIKFRDNTFKEVVEVVDINLADVTILWKALADYVQVLVNKYSGERDAVPAIPPSSWPTIPAPLQTAKGSLSLIPINKITVSLLIVALIFFFPLILLAMAIAMIIIAYDRPFFTRLLHSVPIRRNIQYLDPDFASKELIYAVNSIFSQLKTRSIPGGTQYLLGKFRFHGNMKFFFGYDLDTSVPDSEQQLLHYTALCCQILCLGLQSFTQAHTGNLQFSFLDHEVSTIHLGGSGLSLKNVVASLQVLTCFGNMTKSPVLVFQGVDPTDPPSRENGEKPSDIISSLENIAYLWGSSRYNYTFNPKDGRIVIDPVYLHGGLLHPAQSNPVDDHRHDFLTEFWHWTPETDTQFLKIIESLEKRLPETPKVRIGAPTINKQCPLSSDENQRQFRRIAQDHLEALEAFAPHWELNTVQGGLQGGQWVVPQVMVGWQKLPGRTRKQGILDPGNYLLIPELGKYWGLQFSLCTGVLWRVPLQQVLAACIEQYMANRIPQMPEWRELKETHRMVHVLHGGKLAAWFQQLPDQYQIPASSIIKEILHRLQHTGVDDENMLRIGWARIENGIECLKIPCTNGNSWAKMLADSTETVTFACVTEKCLETSGRIRTCSKIRPSTFNTHRPLQLCTQVRPKGVDYNSRATSDEWRIRDGKSYWMGRDDLMLLANVAIERGSTILRVKRSSMPVKLFKRMNTRATVRETNDDGAVDCIVVADD